MLMPSFQHDDDERSVGDLFAQLAGELKLLVGKEIQLAKLEMSREVRKARSGVVSAGVGAAIAAVGALALTAAVIAFLSNYMPVWLSALIVAVVMLIAGYATIRVGTRKLKGTRLVPVQTIDTLKEDTQWAKTQLKSKASAVRSATRTEPVVPTQRPSVASERR